MERRPRKQIQYFSDADKSLTDFSASESEYEEESDSVKSEDENENPRVPVLTIKSAHDNFTKSEDENEDPRVAVLAVKSAHNSFTNTEQLNQEQPVKQKKKRYARKLDLCIICKKEYREIGQHFRKSHPDHQKVKPIVAETNKTRRRKLFSSLVGEGRSYQNAISVEDGGDYNMKYCKPNVSYKCEETKVTTCSSCKQTFLARTYKFHTCLEDGNNPQPYVKTKEELKKTNNVSITKEFHNIISTLKTDDIKSIILKDSTILNCGDKMVKRKQSPMYIRSSLRGLARYLQLFQEFTNNPLVDLKETFLPHNLKYVYDVGRKYSSEWDHPDSLNLLRNSLGFVLDVLCQQTSTVDDYNYWQMIIHHFDMEWLFVIRPQIRTKKVDVSLLKEIYIPTSAELKHLNDHITQTLKSIMEKEILNYEAYQEICLYTIAKITLFNFRRCNEVAKMCTIQFEKRKKNPGETSLYLNLSAAEKEVAQWMEIVTLKGKSTVNQIVAAVLTPDMVLAIQKIISVRHCFPIEKENNYLFARANSETFFNGYEAISEVVMRADLENGHKITSSKLRKYISTEMVWLNISKQQRKILCSHLGHTFKTNLNIYDHHMRTAVHNIVPAMLVALDSGLKLKNLDDLTDADVRKILEQSHEIERLEDESAELSKDMESSAQSENPPTGEIGSSLAVGTSTSKEVNLKRSFAWDSELEIDPKERALTNRKKRTATSRIQWTAEMRGVMKSIFKGKLKAGAGRVTNEEVAQARRELVKFVPGKNASITGKKIRSFVSNAQLGKIKL